VAEQKKEGGDINVNREKRSGDIFLGAGKYGMLDRERDRSPNLVGRREMKGLGRNTYDKSHWM